MFSQNALPTFITAVLLGFLAGCGTASPRAENAKGNAGGDWKQVSELLAGVGVVGELARLEDAGDRWRASVARSPTEASIKPTSNAESQVFTDLLKDFEILKADGRVVDLSTGKPVVK